jgi:histidine phosphotransferase ChpT
MYNNNPALASLISARICHDLANPIGAISNGLELMELSGNPQTPEFQLTAESVQNATAKLNFFRIAFGPTTGTELSPPEITRILAEVFNSARSAVVWNITNDIARQDAKILFLLIQCLNSAMPRGGTVTVSNTGAQTTLNAHGDKISCDDASWQPLLKNTAFTDLKASDVHFELARMECEIANKSIKLDHSDDHAIITL